MLTKGEEIGEYGAATSITKVAKSLLSASAADLRSIPKLLVPGIGGVKVISYADSFKCTQSLLSEDGGRFSRVNFQRVGPDLNDG